MVLYLKELRIMIGEASCQVIQERHYGQKVMKSKNFLKSFNLNLAISIMQIILLLNPLLRRITLTLQILIQTWVLKHMTTIDLHV